jgi:general nucleoside transport system ATP-binding protein
MGNKVRQDDQNAVQMSNKEFVRQAIADARALGTATLLISEDLDEIRALSDRIAVIYEGRIMGVLDGRTASLQELGLMMAGSGT